MWEESNTGNKYLITDSTAEVLDSTSQKDSPQQNLSRPETMRPNAPLVLVAGLSKVYTMRDMTTNSLIKLCCKASYISIWHLRNQLIRLAYWPSEWKDERLYERKMEQRTLARNKVWQYVLPLMSAYNLLQYQTCYISSSQNDLPNKLIQSCVYSLHKQVFQKMLR